VNIALGIERRTEKLVLNTDTAFQTGDLTGQGAPPCPSTAAITSPNSWAKWRCRSSTAC
jgi:hypothetical protein